MDAARYSWRRWRNPKPLIGSEKGGASIGRWNPRMARDTSALPNTQEVPMNGMPPRY